MINAWGLCRRVQRVDKVKFAIGVAVIKTSMPQGRAAEHLDAVEGSWSIDIATVAFSELDEPQAVSDLVNWGSRVASRRPETCSWTGRAEKRSRGAPRNFLIGQLVEVNRRPDPRHAERTAECTKDLRHPAHGPCHARIMLELFCPAALSPFISALPSSPWAQATDANRDLFLEFGTTFESLMEDRDLGDWLTKSMPSAKKRRWRPDIRARRPRVTLVVIEGANYYKACSSLLDEPRRGGCVSEDE